LREAGSAPQLFVRITVYFVSFYTVKNKPKILR